MLYSPVNTIWVLVGAALVFFMQAGFSLCEAGFTRAKNTGNILMKNLMDFCIGTPAFWLVGFGIMFGAGNGIVGSFDPLIKGDYGIYFHRVCRFGLLQFSRPCSVQHLRPLFPEPWQREQNSVHIVFTLLPFHC